MADQLYVLPKQLDFILDDQHRFVLYSGCYGGGKTRALCMAAVHAARLPGARVGLCRAKFTWLRSSTLLTLLEPSGGLPPVLPEEMIEFHNQNKFQIKLIGGGSIYYSGLDNMDKFGSMEFTHLFIDEIADGPISEALFDKLRSRIRITVPGVTNQIKGACNPSAPSHWLVRLFGLSEEYPTPVSDEYRCIQTNVFENPFLDPEYVQDLLSYEGVDYKRYVLGQWAGSDGLVYSKFDRRRHVARRDKANVEIKRAVVGYDDGWTDPIGAIAVVEGTDGRIYLEAEQYGSELQMAERVARVKGLAQAADTNTVVSDPSAPTAISAMREVGLDVHKGYNKIIEGVKIVERELNSGNLVVSPDCVDTIRELESYERMYDRQSAAWADKPADKNNHLMDAMRYAITFLRANDRLFVKSCDWRTLVQPFQLQSKWPIYASVHYSGGAMSGSFCTYGPAGTIFIIDEFEERNKSLPAVVALVKEKIEKLPNPPKYVILNDEAWEYRFGRTQSPARQLKALGVRTYRAPAAARVGLHSGLDILRTRLENGRLRIWKHCKRTIDAIEACRYKEGTVKLDENVDTTLIHAIVEVVSYVHPLISMELAKQ